MSGSTKPIIESAPVARLHRFQCPQCGWTSWHCRYRLLASRGSKQFTMVFRCGQCGVVAVQRNRRPRFVPTLVEGVIAFGLLYWMLNSAISVGVKIGLLILLTALRAAIYALVSRLTNRYVSYTPPAENNEFVR